MRLASALTSLALLLLAVPTTARAADHIDGPAAAAEPSADITDLFAWMSPDAERVQLVLNVAPFAGPEAGFSDAVVYAFHVESTTAYGQPGETTVIRCAFYDAQAVECWAGDAYVAGDASDPAGVASGDGALQVFAGRRNDPFFMEFTGFNNAVAAVVAAAPSLTFDDAGCPGVDADTSAALVGLLSSGDDGAPASDTFAGTEVLSLVLSVDKALVTSGGPVLAVWASTHAIQ